MTDTVDRFSGRIENYVKYRPTYPPEIAQFLIDNCGLDQSSVMADIGCGTGIFCKIFVENDIKVVGVEPNAAMRSAAQEYLAEFGSFRLVDGTAESTTLDDSSIDLITAAQAFHWFDPAIAKREFQRILKPGGRVALIWNERSLTADAFHVEYEQLLIKFATDYQAVRHDKYDDEFISGYFDAVVQKRAFENVQIFDRNGLIGRTLSSSYMPNSGDASFLKMLAEIEGLFAKHAENGRIKVLYDSKVYLSQV